MWPKSKSLILGLLTYFSLCAGIVCAQEVFVTPSPAWVEPDPYHVINLVKVVKDSLRRNQESSGVYCPQGSRMNKVKTVGRYSFYECMLHHEKISFK